MERERDKNGHLKAGIRLPGWDYCKPWFYMITLAVKRRRPILGEIRDGRLIPTPLGQAVASAWKNLGTVFPEVEPCQYAVMPEHFHGIIWVHKRLASPLGEIIRSFKIACTKANLALESPVVIDGSTTFWFPGIYDTILFGKGQLKNMTRYVLRNAERRWAVMQNPNLFKVTRAVDLAAMIESALGERTATPEPSGQPMPPNARALPTAPCAGVTPTVPCARVTPAAPRARVTPAAPRAAFSLPASCDAIGNAFLAELPNKMLIQLSRRATPAEIEAKTNEAILFGNRGGVIVSGCISPGEQAVARAIREAGLPLIAIVPRGFGPYFKPQGAYFDACAAGKLLMLSPFPQISKYDKLTRERCFGINALAAALCGEDPAAIRYHGSQPDLPNRAFRSNTPAPGPCQPRPARRFLSSSASTAST